MCDEDALNKFCDADKTDFFAVKNCDEERRFGELSDFDEELRNESCGATVNDLR